MLPKENRRKRTHVDMQVWAYTRKHAHIYTHAHRQVGDITHWWNRAYCQAHQGRHTQNCWSWRSRGEYSPRCSPHRGSYLQGERPSFSSDTDMYQIYNKSSRTWSQILCLSQQISLLTHIFKTSTRNVKCGKLQLFSWGGVIRWLYLLDLMTDPHFVTVIGCIDNTAWIMKMNRVYKLFHMLNLVWSRLG